MRPHRDDKVLTAWNGLMIASLANAGAALDQPDWIDAAKRAFQFICDKLGDGNQLFHAYRAGKRQQSAMHAMGQPLSDTDIQMVSDYYATLAPR